MRSGWFVAAAVALAATGCTTAPLWQRVDLGTLRPATILAAGDEVLVGGSASGGPALVTLDASGQVSPVTISPDGPEAEAAELVHLAVRGDRLQALGTMISGAHSNPRWTVWDGSLSDRSLISHPQEFFTFGGHDAGPLLGIDWVEGSPVVLGSRTTATGARAALYYSQGSRWQEAAERPVELTSTRTSQLGFGQLASTGEQLVIAGDEVLLTQPLRQRPLAWVGNPGGSWTRLEPAVPNADGAGLARAQAVTCPDTGSCWMAGWVHGQLLAWEVTTGEHPSVGPAQTPAGTSSVLAAGSSDPDPQLAFWSGRPVLAGNGPDASLLVRCDSGWRSLPLPDRNGDGSNTVHPSQSNSKEPSPQSPSASGTVTGLAGVGDRLYVLIDRTLWVLDTGPC
jgi:hypothetical protein